MSSFFANVIIIARFQAPVPAGRGPLSFASRGDAPPAHDVTSTADTNDNDLRWCMWWRTLRLSCQPAFRRRKGPATAAGPSASKADARGKRNTPARIKPPPIEIGSPAKDDSCRFESDIRLSSGKHEDPAKALESATRLFPYKLWNQPSQR